jgi:hypothetical protein
MDVGRLLEITFVLIVLYLVLSKARDFGSAVGSIGEAYVKGVKVLQGR